LVEFALCAPLLFVLVLGIIEFGREMMVLEILNNAARSGGRVGALAGNANADISNAVNTNLNNSGINGATIAIQVNGSTVDASTARTGDTVSVSVSVPANSVTWLPLPQFLAGKTFSGSVAMRRE
jgi:Flp pilus assembly protein TadG